MNKAWWFVVGVVVGVSIMYAIQYRADKGGVHFKVIRLEENTTGWDDINDILNTTIWSVSDAGVVSCKVKDQWWYHHEDNLNWPGHYYRNKAEADSSWCARLPELREKALKNLEKLKDCEK